MHASKLRPAFVLSTAQEFVFRTHGCDFYGGKIIGKNPVVPSRVAPKLQRGKKFSYHEVSRWQQDCWCQDERMVQSPVHEELSTLLC